MVGVDTDQHACYTEEIFSSLPSNAPPQPANDAVTGPGLELNETIKALEEKATLGKVGGLLTPHVVTPAVAVPSYLPSLALETGSGRTSESSSLKTNYILARSTVSTPASDSAPCVFSTSMDRTGQLESNLGVSSIFIEQMPSLALVQQSGEGSAKYTSGDADDSVGAIVTPEATRPMHLSLWGLKNWDEVSDYASSQASNQCVASMSSPALFTQTPGWLGARSNDLADDYFSYKKDPISSLQLAVAKLNDGSSRISAIKNATKELILNIEKERAKISEKRDRLAFIDRQAVTSPSLRTSITCGVGFNVDGSGPGFRWLVPPVEAARPVSQQIFATSISTQTCIPYDSANAQPSVDVQHYGALACEGPVMEDSQPDRMAGTLQRPPLIAMDSTSMDTPSPIESLPSPVVLCSTRDTHF